MIRQHLAAAAVSLGIAAPVAVFAFDREAPITIHSAAMTRPAAPGGVAIATYDLSRAQSCPTGVQRFVIDGAGVQHRYEPYSAPSFGPVGRETKSVEIVVPRSATPGKARYRLVLSFKCNIFQRLWPIVLTLPDLPFTIQEPGQ